MRRDTYPPHHGTAKEAFDTRHPVAIVGAGPVGLTAAVDLGQYGVPVVVLDEKDTVSRESRAISWAKRTLEIFDRLDSVKPMMAKGITWNQGRVFHGEKELYRFNLLPEPHHKFPAFINLQQYYVEEALVDRCNALQTIDLRWRHRVVGVAQDSDGVSLKVETPEGPYHLHCEYLIAADGARSTVRRLLGLEFTGRVFENRSLISDVKMKADYPIERRFWFEPPFHPGPSAVLHRQADDTWRIDLPLGLDVDPEEEKKPERIIPRLKAMLGPDRPFELVWASVYRFQCRMLERFRHGRIVFAGDSAHQFSPYGGRGGNSGIQDAENIAWKLALVLAGAALDTLLESYDAERTQAARENIKITSGTTEFILARGGAAVAFRDAVLELAETVPFARAFVNSGRLSTPTIYHSSPLVTVDRDVFASTLVPGAVAADAPIRRQGRDGWLLEELGNGFTLLLFGDARATETVLSSSGAEWPPIRLVTVAAEGEIGTVVDVKGVAFSRYDAQSGTAYLIRPDQHVAARWRAVEADALHSALARATSRAGEYPGD